MRLMTTDLHSCVKDLFFFFFFKLLILDSSFLQGSIKKKIESFRRWSSASIKRHPKPKDKTLSLSSPDGDPEYLWLPGGDKQKLRPNSVFGQVGEQLQHDGTLGSYCEVYMLTQ